MFSLSFLFSPSLFSSCFFTVYNIQVKERLTEVASTYMPSTRSEKKSDVVDNDGSATKVTVVNYAGSDKSDGSVTKVTVVKYAGSDESVEGSSEKEVEENQPEKDSLKEKYI